MRNDLKITRGGWVVVSEPLDSDAASNWTQTPEASVLSFSPSNASVPRLANFSPTPVGLAAE